VPIVEICIYCDEKIVPKDKFVVITKAEKNRGTPQVIAHVACAQQLDRGS
jgi:hypothetical protein